MTPAHSSRIRSTLRAFAMVVGSGLLLWRTGATWAVVLVFLTGGLLALALVMPRVYALVSNALDRIQKSTLRAFTWVVLSVVFIVVFIPGRLVFGSRNPAFRRNPALNTYWKEPRLSTAASFDRQY